jgi:hypothetical protein
LRALLLRQGSTAMNVTRLRWFRARPNTAVSAACLAFALASWTLPNYAAQTSSSFNVTVTLQSAAGSGGNAGVCRTDTGVGTFGAAVTVVCGTPPVTGSDGAAQPGSSWRPINSGAYRFLTHVVSRELSGTIDSYPGAGTSTAFRVVNLAGREYVEMTVGW